MAHENNFQKIQFLIEISYFDQFKDFLIFYTKFQYNFLFNATANMIFLIHETGFSTIQNPIVPCHTMWGLCVGGATKSDKYKKSDGNLRYTNRASSRDELSPPWRILLCLTTKLSIW